MVKLYVRLNLTHMRRNPVSFREESPACCGVSAEDGMSATARRVSAAVVLVKRQPPKLSWKDKPLHLEPSFMKRSLLADVPTGIRTKHEGVGKQRPCPCKRRLA